MTNLNLLVRACLALLLLGPAATALSAESATEVVAPTKVKKKVAPRDLSMCVYDPVGKHGDLFNLAKDYRVQALEWGVRIELRPFQSEQLAASEFKSGKCDLAWLTGIRTRDFVPFAGTIEAMGAIPDYDHLRDVIKLLAKPESATYMRKGKYEVLGIFSVGGVFLFLRDRRFTSVKDLAGKRFATLAHDEAGMWLVQRVGAATVPADVSTFSGMFINGGVDACYANAATYQPLELGKGLTKGGGIPEMPVTQLTMHIIGRSNGELPADFGEKSRRWAAANYDRTVEVALAAEKTIPKKYWIQVTDGQRQRYNELFLEARVSLRDEGVYDGTMLKLLRRVRCKHDATRAECASSKE